MNLMIVVGARPNFIKLAPFIREIEKQGVFDYRIVHTGQHYDDCMSSNFFRELDIPAPDVNLEVCSSYPARQTCKIIDKLELLCYKERPDCMVVIGDVTSTMAGAIVASKIPGIRIAHIESGERSYDRAMPEEINRIVTDHLSDYLFCTNQMADSNLHKEGISVDRRFVVGNLMVDNLKYWEDEINISLPEKFNPFIVLTLHRASNVDDPDTLQSILKAIEIISYENEIIFPIHPRTASRIKKFNLSNYLSKVNVQSPMGYKEFLNYVKHSDLVITDSGGLQIEAAYLGTNCITLRYNTEHMCTIQQGCNVLAGTDTDEILETFYFMHDEDRNIKIYDPTWDGKTSERIINILRDRL